MRGFDDTDSGDLCKEDIVPSRRPRWLQGLISQADLLRAELRHVSLYRNFICKPGHYGDRSSRLLSQVLFCYSCSKSRADADKALPPLELLPLPLPPNAPVEYAHYAISLPGIISELLAHQVDSPEADDAARGLNDHDSFVGFSEIPHTNEDHEGTDLRVGVVRVSSICNTDGVHCLHLKSHHAEKLTSAPISSRTSRLKRMYDSDTDSYDSGEDQEVSQINEDIPNDIQATEVLVPAPTHTLLTTSTPSSIPLEPPATKIELEDIIAALTPDFVKDPQTRKIFRSLAIVALIVCVKWLLIKYVRKTTAYRRRRADILARTEERRRGWRYRNAARRYRLNMWVRRQVRRVGRPGRRRGENNNGQRPGNRDGGGAADTENTINNGYQATPNGASPPTHSTRPPLMEEELIGFRRVLEYVGELVRGDIYDSDSFSTAPSMDLELAYDSDISLSEYNHDNDNNGDSEGATRPARRSGFMNIAWEYGYRPGRFATPPPSSIAQLTTFSSPRTSDEASEAPGGRLDHDSASVSDDGTFMTGIETNSEQPNGRGDGEEISQHRTSISDDGMEETDLLIARVESLKPK